MPGALKTLATFPLPGEAHAGGPSLRGHFFKGSSEKDCRYSKSAPHVSQRYWYVGMGPLLGDSSASPSAKREQDTRGT